MSVEIVGPFKEHRLVIDGWSVPLMTAYEADGGEMWLILDHSMSLVIPAEHFELVARFVADVIGRCFGYGAHPQADEWYERAGLESQFADPSSAFRFVPHPTLAPHRVNEITAISGDDES